MLIITRKAGERIVIGDDVIVHVMELSGSTVRLGIEAPRSTRIYREEVWAAVQAQNEEAAAAASADLPELPENTARPPGA